MTATIEPQTLRTIEGPKGKEKRVITEGFIVKENGKKIGFERTLQAAQALKKKHDKEGSPVLGAKFSIESHTNQTRDEKTGKVTRVAGFLLRSDKGNYSKFSEDKSELQEIISKAKKNENSIDTGPERLTPEEKATLKKEKAAAKKAEKKAKAKAAKKKKAGKK